MEIEIKIECVPLLVSVLGSPDEWEYDGIFLDGSDIDIEILLSENVLKQIDRAVNEAFQTQGEDSGHDDR